MSESAPAKATSQPAPQGWCCAGRKAASARSWKSLSGPQSCCLSDPTLEQSVRRNGLDLLAIAAMVEREHRIVRLVRGTAEPVRNDDDAITAIDRAEHGAEHAHVRLTTRDHERVDATRSQALVEVRLNPR